LSPEQAQKMAADFATNGRTVEDVITCLEVLPALPELNMAEDHGATAGAETPLDENDDFYLHAVGKKAVK
jgi:hypothetical protein